MSRIASARDIRPIAETAGDPTVKAKRKSNRTDKINESVRELLDD
jgi:hypothetical protein